MSVKPRPQSSPSSVIEIKGSSFTLPVMKLLEANIDAVACQLGETVEQAPDFFRNAPLVIDLSKLASSKTPIDFGLLVDQIRNFGITPIGIRGGSKQQNDTAQKSGLAILSYGKSTSDADKNPAPAAKKAPHSQAPTQKNTLLIEQPVRSGQRIYAIDSDLIVLAPVSAGAEIMADGHIHVYGTLRGRALAGVKGNLETRIFCHNLQAELISISGQYQTSEGIKDSQRGKSVQIYLSDTTLAIEEL